MSFRKSAFTRSLVVLVTVAILNVGAFAGQAFGNRLEANPYSLFLGTVINFTLCLRQGMAS